MSEDLDSAIEQDDFHAVRQLLLSFNDERILKNGPASLLHLAVGIGHIASVMYLLERQPYITDADVRDSCLAWTPLMYAVANKDLDMIKYLVSTGKFHLDAKDVNDQTALHIAALSKDMPTEALTIMVRSGSDIEAEDLNLRTPFLKAVEENNLPVAQMLHSMNCNIHKMTAERHSALHLAVTSCDDWMIQWLIEIGCSVNATDNNLQTPLMILVQEKKQQTLLQQMMRSLIRAGATLSQQDVNGCSVFLHAVSNHLSISKQHLQCLIDNGSDVDLSDNTGLSPLWQAVFDCGHYADRAEVVQLLVQHNCQLNKQCCGKLLFTSGQHWIYCYETPLSPFEVALDSSCYAVAHLLFYAGCQVRPEVRYDYCQQSVVPAEVSWLKEAMQNVFSLQHLCCLTLRKILGQNIHFKVGCLSIPSRLRSLILLDDLTFSVDVVAK